MVRIFHNANIHEYGDTEETLENEINEYLEELERDGIAYEVLPPSTASFPWDKDEYALSLTIVVVTKARGKR